MNSYVPLWCGSWCFVYSYDRCLFSYVRPRHILCSVHLEELTSYPTLPVHSFLHLHTHSLAHTYALLLTVCNCTHLEYSFMIDERTKSDFLILILSLQPAHRPDVALRVRVMSRAPQSPAQRCSRVQRTHHKLDRAAATMWAAATPTITAQST